MLEIKNVIQVKIKDEQQYKKLLEECEKRGLVTSFNPLEKDSTFRYSKYFKSFSAWCFEPYFPEISEEEFINFLDYRYDKVRKVS